jgi:chemotaxis protein methyltransferase CheR
MKTQGMPRQKLSPEEFLPFDEPERPRKLSGGIELSPGFTVNAALFEQFAELAYRRAGIRLGAGKEALVAARIGKRIRTLGLKGPRDYLDYLLTDDQGEEIVHFLDVISTNFTSFYREPAHFPLLGDLVEQRLALGRHRMRFWSAACSSGEEPYTMALSIAERLGDKAADWRILATDISTRILAAAQTGRYPASALKTVPKHLRLRYFESASTKSSNEPLFSIKHDLRNHIAFARLNLSTPPFPMSGPLDVVMCRNVMIYFDHRVRQNLVTAVENLLAPDGIFFIGHAETLNGLHTSFRAIRPSVYVLPSSPVFPTARTSLYPKRSVE